MQRLLCLAAVSLLAIPAAALARQHEGHAMPPDQIGSTSVAFATSCAPAVRDDFNKAVALLHSFWFPEAIKAFEGVAQKAGDLIFEIMELADEMRAGRCDKIDKPIEMAREFANLARVAADASGAILTRKAMVDDRDELEVMLRKRIAEGEK
jgi:hypothetical protein